MFIFIMVKNIARKITQRKKKIASDSKRDEAAREKTKMEATTIAYEEKDALSKKRTSRPILNEGIGRFPERLKEVIGGMSIREFARKVGVSDASIRDYLRGESFPSLDRLDAIAAAVGVSPAWLATGEGPMHPGEQEETFSEDEFALVPLFNVEVSAGYGAAVEEERIVGKLAFRKDWLAEEGLLGRHLTVVTARGDSMMPTIWEGDVLLIDTWVMPDGRQLQPSKLADGIYIIRMEGDLMVKRLQSDFQGGVFVRSDNPAYKEIHVPGERVKDLNVVGKVVWFGRRV